MALKTDLQMILSPKPQLITTMQPAVRYLFIVPEYVTDFGQQLKVVGSFPELGSWDARAAPSMSWREGHSWQLDVMLPSQPFEFKVHRSIPISTNGHQISCCC